MAYQMISALLTGQVPVGSQVTVKGWVRSHRQSKADGGLSFIAVSDGSCFDTCGNPAHCSASEQPCRPLHLCCSGDCADPLADVPRISDVDLADTDPTANAVPSAEEIAREGFFTSIFGGVSDGGSDQSDVPLGQALPYGKVGRVCEAKGKKLGAGRQSSSRMISSSADSKAQ